MRVKDKSIIATGAGGRIGEGIAHRLAEEGAQVVVNDIAADRGEAVAAAIRAKGGRASFFRADVTASRWTAPAASETGLIPVIWQGIALPAQWGHG